MDTNVAGDAGRSADGDEHGTGGREAGPPRSVSLDVLPDAALLIDGEGAVVAVNELARTLFGHDPTGEAVAGLLDQAELPVAAEAPLRLRVQGRHGDRVAFIADISVADSALAPGHRLVLLRELETGLLIEESRRLLDLAFESAPIGMAFFNPEGEYIRVNAALCGLLDRPPTGSSVTATRSSRTPATANPRSPPRGRSSTARSTPGRPRSASCAPTAPSSGRSRT